MEGGQASDRQKEKDEQAQRPQNVGALASRGHPGVFPTGSLAPRAKAESVCLTVIPHHKEPRGTCQGAQALFQMPREAGKITSMTTGPGRDGRTREQGRGAGTENPPCSRETWGERRGRRCTGGEGAADSARREGGGRGGFSGKLSPTEAQAPPRELRAVTASEGDASLAAPQELRASACVSHLPPQLPIGTIEAARK